MVLGTFGSTLNDELNRLANGGTYRTMASMVDEALAAKQWANRENINPYSTDTVGILNEIAGLGTDKRNWLDFNGVCNYIAGTTGLPAAAALRQVYPTTDLLTGVASYYVDATAPTNWGSLGYVYFPYSTTSYLSVPDSSSLDITGDIDIRVRTSMDDWTPSVQGGFIFKDNATGNQRSWQFRILTTGILYFGWTTDGSTLLTAQSTVATGITDGAVKWIRVTMDVDNGASGRDIKFWTSDDNITWTQLGTTVTQAGTTSIYSGSAAVEIGAAPSPGLGYAGNFYQAQVYASLNGTDKRLDVNIATDWKASELVSFTATTGGTVYPFGIGTISNLGTAGSLLPTTMGSSYSTDSNDPKFLDFTGTNYVYAVGSAENNLSVPDAANLRITGDIDIRVQVAMDDWTPAAAQFFAGKYGASGNRAWTFGVLTNGRLYADFSLDGTAVVSPTSSVATGITDGTSKWVRVTRIASTGVVKFFTSDDAITWTQLGTDVSSTSGNIFASTNAVSFAHYTTLNTGDGLVGKFYRGQVLNGIDGTKVLDVDTSVITTGSATSFTALTNQTVTINRSTSGRKTVAVTQPTWLFGTDDYMEVNNRYMAHSTSDENYVYLSGASGNYMSVADNPPLDIAGDIDIQVKVALDDWTPASDQIFLSKYNTSQQSYYFRTLASGVLQLGWSTTGSNSLTANSTVAPTITDGAVKWVRVTLDVDNGASGRDIKFFTSDDGTNWTQLGSTVTQAGTTSIFSGTTNVEIGSAFIGTINFAKGKFYRAIIKNGIDGTTVLDANAAVITLPSQTTFTDSSSNAYTVTINKSGVGTFVSTGNYLYLPGIASNYASAPDSAALDITGDIDIRVKVALDDWTPSANNALLYKWDSAGTSASYGLRVNATTGVLVFLWTANGSTVNSAASTVAPTVTDGSTLWVRATLTVNNGASGNDVKFYTSSDGITWNQLGSTVTTAGVTSIFSGTGVLEVGSFAGGLNPSRGKFFRAQVRNGINGTVAFDANFETSITSLNQASFTESSANAATVTINRSGSAYRSAGITTAGYLYPGATNTFSASATDYLNFGASDSFTVMAIVRNWATTVTNSRILSKTGTNTRGYDLYNNAATTVAGQFVDSTSAKYTNNSTALTSGSLSSLNLLVNRSTNLATIYVNQTANTAANISTLGSIDSVFNLTIGRSGAAIQYTDMEFYGAAVFRSVLTPTQIRQITNYFANREVYL